MRPAIALVYDAFAAASTSNAERWFIHEITEHRRDGA